MNLQSPESELAWAAGFFDGEGHTSQLRRKSRRDSEVIFTYVQIGVSQLDRRPLERFMAAVGGGNITRPAGTSPCWNWRATGKPAERVMGLLWPYLSEPKKEQYVVKGGDAPDELAEYPALRQDDQASISS